MIVGIRCGPSIIRNSALNGFVLSGSLSKAAENFFGDSIAISV
jgi:hypothetical protein